ncbi:hypothetical protein [Paenibacillus aceris]|uniref:ABC-type bacteriocin/lantibiotic exporter with double-glycine peptidase domain n=1 Tax=Paenibacillus aceris TaxID=869555 RepID=A0ABS4HRD3_9BACL|nr:hypothetical protein [Paenibacillus aceris]MBP1961173.1 ABC-type bacteriocin/lantibiotic exporter with double-glycine peptidase domain [Paenibacillus aceris]
MIVIVVMVVVMMNMTMVVMMIMMLVMVINIMIRSVIDKEIRAIIVMMGRITSSIPAFAEYTN